MTFNDDFLERIFINDKLRTIPLGCQSVAIHIFEQELSKILTENKYATISELFSATEYEQ